MTQRRSQKRIRYTLIVAASLDGKITEGCRAGTSWTSPEDKRWFQKKLDRFDALVMGRRTFEALKRPLTPRNRIIFTRSSVIPSTRPPARQEAGIQIPFVGSPRLLR